MEVLWSSQAHTLAEQCLTAVCWLLTVYELTFYSAASWWDADVGQTPPGRQSREQSAVEHPRLRGPRIPRIPRWSACGVAPRLASFIYMYCSYFICNLFPNGPWSPWVRFLALPPHLFCLLVFQLGALCSTDWMVPSPLRKCVVCQSLAVVGSGGQVWVLVLWGRRAGQ